MPTCGLAQRRGVVHAVAGDRDDLVLVLERGDDAHLLFRLDAGEEDFRGVEGELELDVRQMAELGAGDHDGMRRSAPARSRGRWLPRSADGRR